MSDKTTAYIDCGSCHACCRNQLVLLTDGESPGDYDCYTLEIPAGAQHALKLKPDGSCIYLGNHGCSIWGRHPTMCRIFDCAAFAALWPRKRRRANHMKGRNDVLREGQRRLRYARPI